MGIFDCISQDLFCLLLAAFLTGLVGLEREIHGREAGVRTHLLVGLGSCLFMLLSKYIAGTEYDPGRIAAQVVSGIGFLGAGTIIKMKNNIRGLTTAACLWTCSAIGLACASSHSNLAIATTAISILALMCVRSLEKIIGIKDTYKKLSITLNKIRYIKSMQGVKECLNKYQIEIIDFDLHICQRNLIKYNIDIRIGQKNVCAKLMHDLHLIQGVAQVDWTDCDG